MAKKYRHVAAKPETNIINDSNTDIVDTVVDKVKTTIMVRYYPMTMCFMHDIIAIGTEKSYIDNHIATRDALPLFNSNADCLYYGEFKNIKDIKVSTICDINALNRYIKTYL